MKQPKILIPFTITDIIVEITGVISLIFFWVMLILNYSKLPQIVPIHYNTQGEVDNFGSKMSLIILAIIATVIFIGLSYFSKKPHLLNYPVEIHSHNAEKQYTIATKMLRYLKVSIVWVFFLVFYKTVQIANGQNDFLGKYFLLITLAIIFLPITYFIVQAFKAK